MAARHERRFRTTQIQPNSKVVNFIANQPTDVTLAEITYGIEQLGDAARRTDLRLWLERNLRPLFAGRILAITDGCDRPMEDHGR